MFFQFRKLSFKMEHRFEREAGMFLLARLNLYPREKVGEIRISTLPHQKNTHYNKNAL